MKVLPGWCSSAGVLLIKRGSWRRPVEPVEGDEVLTVVQVDVVRARDDREATAGRGDQPGPCAEGGRPAIYWVVCGFVGAWFYGGGVGRAGGLQSRARGPGRNPKGVGILTS
ncbi:hypothetical protein GCM10011428_34300 [Streptomyces violaceus]